MGVVGVAGGALVAGGGRGVAAGVGLGVVMGVAGSVGSVGSVFSFGLLPSGVSSSPLSSPSGFVFFGGGVNDVTGTASSGAIGGLGSGCVVLGKMIGAAVSIVLDLVTEFPPRKRAIITMVLRRSVRTSGVLTKDIKPGGGCALRCEEKSSMFTNNRDPNTLEWYEQKEMEMNSCSVRGVKQRCVRNMSENKIG